MKKQSTFKQILTLTVTLLLITAGVAAALAGVNKITAPIIEKLNAEKTTKAIAAVLPDAETAEIIYEAAAKEDAVQTVYASESGYAVKVQTAGFGGTGTAAGTVYSRLRERPDDDRCLNSRQKEVGYIRCGRYTGRQKRHYPGLLHGISKVLLQL